MDSVVVEEPVETPEQAAQFTDINKEAPQPSKTEEQPQQEADFEIPPNWADGMWFLTKSLIDDVLDSNLWDGFLCGM